MAQGPVGAEKPGPPPGSGRAVRPGAGPLLARPLLARLHLTRILETPELARIVQSLEPRVLHRLVRHCGLEDSGAIVALATTEQLERVFDHDLWRNEQAGEEERLDADRLALWLQGLARAGEDVAARRLVQMGLGLLTAAP